MGEDAEDILAASNMSINERKDNKKVVKMFADYFIGKQNVIYGTAKFNARVQQEDESIEFYVIDRRKLGEFCNYGN